MKIFLDDERECPEGWELAQTPEEVIAHLETGEVTALSLDHDLGLDVGTGYDVLNWLEKKVAYDTEFPIPEITVHTANVAARLPMEQAVRLIAKIREVGDRWSEG